MYHTKQMMCEFLFQCIYGKQVKLLTLWPNYFCEAEWPPHLHCQNLLTVRKAKSIAIFQGILDRVIGRRGVPCTKLKLSVGQSVLCRPQMARGEYQVNRPHSKFRQQKLNAWQPILTAGSVLPTFFVIGLAFIPIGVALLIASNNVQELVIDYTDCVMEEKLCKDEISDPTKIMENPPCRCLVAFELHHDFSAPVYIYYGLSGFYQNHRRYVKSRDDVQLLGNPKHVSSDCFPFQYAENEIPIAPCGAIANSMFNDTFLIKYKIVDQSDAVVPLSYDEIAWPSDLSKKFRNPDSVPLSAAFEGTSKPPYWRKPVYELSNVSSASGFQNESLIVWMRSAALPNFRKLHSRVLHVDNFANALPKGNYTVEITYNYPVASFDGRKRFIISNASWAGGKNSFLGIAYIVVGTVCIVMGCVFLFVHMKFGHSLTEMAAIRSP
ncbi:Cell cycle control protein 50B [Trichinella murrelli]|uniref:Cell cycle control protein 50B n=1 Tax=Trichinella murrelli TaxID=144512 RepID=A0A0V0TZZ0_9BILA|nr:Cell cycle control protein 50B [Trichinella murrelli]